jgi:hypothetical protein
MARDLGTLQYLVDIDTSGVYAGAAEVEAALKSIPDETVNLKVDTDVESLRVGRAELVKYQKLLKGAIATEEGSMDARKKAYKELPQQLRDFISANSGVDNSLRTIDAALQNNAAAMKEHNDLTKKSAEVADRNSLALTKLAEKHAKLNAEIDKRQRNPFAQDTVRERAAFARLNEELKVTQRQYSALGGNLDNLSTRHDREIERVSRLVRGFADLKLRLGFFSASVRQAAVGLAVLGPAISAVLGGVIALAGSLGQGLVGALGIATAAAGGFGLSLLGIGLAVKPLVSELSTAAKAATDYQKQVLKTGKNSSEAKDKLDAYHQTVKNLPKDTQALIQKTGVLVTEWQKVTAAVRPEFFKTAGVGIQALSNLMPMFAKQTKSAFSVVAKELQTLARGLGGAESKDILSTMMENSTKALPGFIRGIGSITAALGRFGAASSSYLPDISAGFAKFGESISNLTQTSQFQSQVDGLIGQLRSIGALAVSATKYFITLANAGAGSGKQIIDAMTGGFNKWTQWMKSTEGKNSLADFFKQSLTELRLLYSAFSPLIKALARWAKATQPISQGILRIVSVFSSLVEIVSRAGFVMKIFAAFFAARILKNGVAILIGLGRAWTIIRAAIFASTAATAVNTEAMAANAVATEANTVAKVENAAANRMSGLSMLGFGGAATRTAGTVGRLGMTLGTVGRFIGGPWGMAITTAIFGLMMYQDEILGLFGPSETYVQKLQKMKVAQGAVDTSGKAAAEASRNFTEEVISLKDAVDAYNKSVSDGSSWKEQQRNFNAVKAGVKGANEAVNNYASAVQKYDEQNARYRESAQDLARVGSDALFAAGRDVLSTGQQRRLNSLVQQFGWTKRSIDEIGKAFPQLKIPADTINSWQKLSDINIGRVARDINKIRISQGKSPIPKGYEDEIGRVFAALPDNAKKAQGQLASTLMQMNAQTGAQMAVLLQRLQGTKGGKKILPSLLEGMKGQKPAQAIKSVQDALKNLGASGNMPRIKIQGIEQVKSIREEIQKVKQMARSGVNFSIKNLAANSDRLDHMLETFNDFKPKETTLTLHANQDPDPFTVNVKKHMVNAEGGIIGGASADGQRTQGGRFSKATFLVGEENRPEYVIATNPSYRKNNLKYWMQAGAALGVPGFAAGGAVAAGKKPPKDDSKGNKRSLAELEKLYRRKQAVVTRNTDLAALHRRQEDLRQNQGLPFRSQRIEGPLTAVWKATQVIKSLFKPITSKYADKIKAVSKSDLKKDKKKARIRELQDKQREYRQASKNYDITVANAKADLDDFKNEMATGAGGLGASPAVTEALNLLSGNYGLGMQYGSNMLSGAAYVGGANVTAAMGSQSNGTAPRSGGSGRSVTITNNYQEPPSDPHTWSKQLAWEVGVA